MSKKILMILGGTWHDFDGFAAAMTPILEKAGYEVDATYDLDTLTQIEGRYDLVLLNTCIGEVRDDDGPTAPGFTDAHGP